MTFKEFIEFISQSANHFAGFVLILIIVSLLISSIFSSIFDRKIKL